MTVKAVLAFTMITFVAQLVVSLFTLVWGVQIVLPEIVGHSFWLYLALPMLIDFVKLSGALLGTYYIALVLAILASAAWLFLKSWKGFVLELGMKGKSREHSALFDLCGLMFAVLFLNIVIVLFMGATGGLPTDPISSTDLWQLLFLLANASVWEELVTRVLLIGIPLIAIDAIRGRFRNKKLAYILGGGFTFGALEVALVVISSIVFGFAHYEGWGSWKVFPASVAGLAFGYMFMRHGLASAIMLHFSFDYLSLPLEVFDANLALELAMSIGILLWVGLGFVFFAYFVLRMTEFITGLRFAEEKPQLAGVPTVFYPPPVYRSNEVPYVPAPPDSQVGSPATLRSTAAPGFGGVYVCPYCGYTEARWTDGRFQCLRCGRLA